MIVISCQPVVYRTGSNPRTIEILDLIIYFARSDGALISIALSQSSPSLTVLPGCESRCSLGKRAAHSVVLALPGEINRRANSEKILNKIG